MSGVKELQWATYINTDTSGEPPPTYGRHSADASPDLRSAEFKDLLRRKYRTEHGQRTMKHTNTQ